MATAPPRSTTIQPLPFSYALTSFTLTNPNSPPSLWTATETSQAILKAESGQDNERLSITVTPTASATQSPSGETVSQVKGLMLNWEPRELNGIIVSTCRFVPLSLNFKLISSLPPHLFPVQDRHTSSQDSLDRHSRHETQVDEEYVTFPMLSFSFLLPRNLRLILVLFRVLTEVEMTFDLRVTSGFSSHLLEKLADRLKFWARRYAIPSSIS